MIEIARYTFVLLITMSALVSCGNSNHHEHVHNSAVPDVQLNALLKPTNQFVVSSIPVTAIERREEEIHLNVVGVVAQDSRQVGTISSRINGRIEKLYIRYKYQPVKKGQKVMDVYSPELLTAQQNLIFLLHNDPGNAPLIDAAKDRLTLLGMTLNQVKELVNTKTPRYAISVFSNYSGFVTDLSANMSADNRRENNMDTQMAANQELETKEGMYIQSGQPILSVYNPARAWVLLNIFPEQQRLIKKGDAVKIVPDISPHESFPAKIDYIEPVFRAGTKTLTARVYINNSEMLLPIGSRVSAAVFASKANASWLPKEAVLSTGTSRVVFVKQDVGFQAHKVNTGIELNGSIEIVSGLEPEDSVARNAQLLIDNEAFIKVSNE